MVRTRDFLLYVLVLVFILLGISVTVVAQKDRSKTDQFVTDLKTIAGSDSLGSATAGEIDRAKNLAALREKLAKGEGEIIQGAPVFTSVDTPTTTNEPLAQNEINQDAIISASTRSQQLCAGPGYSAVAANWPVSNVTLKVEGGLRVVAGVVTTEVQSGTSTELVNQNRPLLELPIAPVRTLASQCLDSEFVGITPTGSLIKNSDTWRFRQATADTLIGYARDGHPIYGSGVNEELLDSCGGYDTGAGYRYHLRTDELFILGCYTASPQPFID